MEHLEAEDVSLEHFVEPLLERNKDFEGVGFAEKLRLKIGSDEEYGVGLVEKLLVNMGFEEEEEVDFVEKLRVKTGFEEK
ncbi:unnamed protein product [Microthlaspi erraticum]|uniref:Uncharacterized protein n=1 Tax=Microthlaspi erraticum TaxID=1685480 RepID=A0A6D2ISU9_9BRAS|nr:unnamed protein product [Microthlaspi erraticum]